MCSSTWNGNTEAWALQSMVQPHSILPVNHIVWDTIPSKPSHLKIQIPSSLRTNHNKLHSLKICFSSFLVGVHSLLCVGQLLFDRKLYGLLSILVLYTDVFDGNHSGPVMGLLCWRYNANQGKSYSSSISKKTSSICSLLYSFFLISLHFFSLLSDCRVHRTNPSRVILCVWLLHGIRWHHANVSMDVAHKLLPCRFSWSNRHRIRNESLRVVLSTKYPNELLPFS